jgi:hypothetical protein
MAADEAAAEAFRLEQLGRSGSLVGADAILTSLEAQVEAVTRALPGPGRPDDPRRRRLSGGRFRPEASAVSARPHRIAPPWSGC